MLRPITAHLLVLVVTVLSLHAQSPIPPPWAYTVNPPPPPGAKPAPPADAAPHADWGQVTNSALDDVGRGSGVDQQLPILSQKSRSQDRDLPLNRSTTGRFS